MVWNMKTTLTILTTFAVLFLFISIFTTNNVSSQLSEKALPDTKNGLKMEYGQGYDKGCDFEGKCFMALYSGIRNVFENNTWKRTEDAISLKDKGWDIVYLDNDPRYKIDVIDFNATTIEFEVSVTDPKDLNKDIPVKFLKYNEDFNYTNFNEKNLDSEPTFKDTYYEDSRIEKSFSDIDSKEYININSFDLGTIIEFGENSTTIMLQEPGTENLEDLYVLEQYPDNNYGGPAQNTMGAGVSSSSDEIQTFIKFNLSTLPPDSLISDSVLAFYFNNETYESGDNPNISIYEVENQTIQQPRPL